MSGPIVWLLALALGCGGTSDGISAEEDASNSRVPMSVGVPPDPTPDVLLLIVDTLRADAVGVYGSSRPTTPAIDGLAGEGLLFKDVTIAGTWSWPSHASLFTGQPPWVHGAHFAAGDAEGYQPEDDPYQVTALRGDLPTLAERFAASGYRTAVVTANKWLDYGYGLDRGFESVKRHKLDADVRTGVNALLTDGDPRPLFLVVNLFGAHAPYEVQEVPWLEERAAQLDPATAADWARPFLVDRSDGSRALNLFRSPAPGERPGVLSYLAGELEIPPEGLSLLRAVYDGEVWAADQQVGGILEDWDATGRKGGVVALTSDHGEFLGERGLMDHGRMVYPEVVAVPLVIRAPGRIKPGTQETRPVQAHHLFGTLLQMAGIDDSGRSLISAEPEPNPVIQAAAWADDLWSSGVGGRFKEGYRLYREETHAVILSSGDRLECYDMKKDPTMTQDIAQTSEEHCRALASRAKDAFPEHAGGGFVSLDDATRAELKALGYLK